MLELKFDIQTTGNVDLNEKIRLSREAFETQLRDNKLFMEQEGTVTLTNKNEYDMTKFIIKDDETTVPNEALRSFLVRNFSGFMGG
ncbi:hypothetical protein GTQ40_15740 [Flavobacteriaceae bacterium R38]|nr:hypothetical protein [Flavobacteriaceae bacterium R38]